MKNLIYLLLALPLLLTSCSNDESAAMSEETVQMSFRTEVPTKMGTRASSGLTVDKVVCAVFESGNEISALRTTVDAGDGSSITFSPQLIKGRTYNIVFWAMKDGSYDVSDLTAIARAANGPANETDYDAFTATTEITVQNADTKAVTLTRPIAQLNIGITEGDWTAVTSKFNMTPKTVKISFDAQDTYNALAGEVVPGYNTLTYNLNATGDVFTCKEIDYRNIATCYIFAESSTQSQLVDLTYSVYDESDNAIREDAQIIHIPIQANYKTNVVGGLLTGTITYEIALSGSEFLTDDDHNKVIE